jgi:PAS domain S-box-containing protein
MAGRAAYDLEFQIARSDGGAIVDIHSVAEYNAAASTVMGVIEDITARKKSEQSLRASEARYRNIVETSEEGVWMVDAVWRTTFTNRRLEQMFGYEPGKMLGRPITDFMDEPCRTVAVELEHRREQGVRETHDFKFIRRNGEELWAMIATNPIFDAAGVFSGALAMVTDITTRKQQEIFSQIGREVLQILNEPDGLKSSLARVVATLKQLASLDAVGIRLRAGHDFPYFAQEGFNEDFLLTENSLVTQTQEGALCRDEEGKVALECTCGLVLSGCAKSDHPLFTPQGSFWTNDSSALLDLPPAEDPRLHRRNRCIHQGYASVLLVPIRNGNLILGLLQFNARRKGCFTLNMVEHLEEIAGQIGLSLMRKHAEIARRESEEKFARIFQTSPVAILLSTLQDGRLLSVNDAFLNLLERTRDEVVGRTTTELGIWVDPATRSTWVEKINQASGIHNVEFEIRSQSGRIHHLLWSGEELLVGGESCLLSTALDITERKAAEREREQERQLLRILIDHIPDMIYVRDTANRFLIANQTFARHMGVATTAELVGRTDADFYPPEVATKYAATDQRIFSGDELVNFECSIHFPNGDRLNVVNTKIPLKDNKGRVLGLVGICRDVTEQKRAAEAGARLVAIVESSSDGIIGKDLQGIITSWNPGAEKLFGYTAGEIVGTSIRRLIPADRQREEDDILERICRGENVTHFDTVRQAKDGHLLDVSVTASPIKDATGKIIGASKTIRDITGRKLAEQKLRDNEERYRQLFELESDAIFLVDAETHRFEDVNQSAERLYGYSREEFRELKAEDVSTEPEKTRRNVASGHYLVPIRWHRKKDGRVFPVEITANRIAFQGRQFELTAVRDITARQMAFDQLQQTTTQLLDAQKLASLGSYVLDVVTGAWTCSRALDQLFGITENGFVKDVAGWLALVHPDEQAELRQYLNEQVLGNKAEFDRTYRIVRVNDRQERWVHGIGKLVLDEHGKVLRMVGVIQDVTERQQTELALTFQNRLSQVLLALPPLADHLDENTFFQRALEQAEELTGSQISFAHFVNDDEKSIELVTWSRRTVEHYCQADFNRHYSVTEAGLWADALRERRPLVVNDYAANPHKRGLPAGHSELKRLVSLPVLENEKVVLLVGIGNKAQDYTTREVNALQHIANLIWRLTQRRREAAARTRLAAAVEQAAESVVITDTEGRIVYVNPAFEKTTGFTRAELLGQNPRLLKSGQHNASFYRQIWDTLQRGDAWNGHFINKRKDGTLFEEEATISPIRDAQDTIINYLAVKRDVTREAQLEAQFRQTQKLEAIGTLAGGIAHDFNNILGAMSGFAYLLRQDTEGNAPAQEGVAEILAAINRAKDLVQQILTFSRQREQSRRVIQLETVVKETTKFLRASLPAYVQIDLQLAPDTPTVLADPTQIYQVVLNLGTNALHAMEASGGRLTVSLEPFVPDERFLVAHPEFRAIPYARLTVADTGHGMETRTLERIYEPFFTTKPVGKGTGLGLAVVHGIIKSHDGVITVESHVGQGTTFRLYFPAQVGGQDLTEAKATPIRSGGGQKILLVDDEPALTTVLQRSLRRFHYEITTSNHPEEALRLFKESSGEFDLVVTDLTMPGMSGLELARQLRMIRPELPVILMSGYTGSVTDEMLREAGIFELMDKPVAPLALAEVVQRALAKT